MRSPRLLASVGVQAWPARKLPAPPRQPRLAARSIPKRHRTALAALYKGSLMLSHIHPANVAGMRSSKRNFEFTVLGSCRQSACVVSTHNFYAREELRASVRLLRQLFLAVSMAQCVDLHLWGLPADCTHEAAPAITSEAVWDTFRFSALMHTVKEQSRR
jgi:hypothetical protein